MCGRYVNVAATDDLLREFEAAEAVGEDLPPSWNVAPTDPVRIVARRRPAGSTRHGSGTDGGTADGRGADGGGDPAPVRQLRTVRWGLLPSWSTSRTGGAKMINARSETVADKPAFRAAAARRRCLVPSLGYYEWQQTGHGKIPYFLHDPVQRTLAMAGLYEIWHDRALPDDDPQAWVWTCTVITRPATDALGRIHDRCPVLVPSELRAPWLDCSDDDPEQARRLLEAMPEPHLEPRRVPRAVGNVRNNGPELIEPDRGADGDAGRPAGHDARTGPARGPARPEQGQLPLDDPAAGP